MSEGWVSIHRKLQENDLWTTEPFTRGQAWVDLILLANHKPGYIYVRDHKIDLERGDVGWSQNRLSERWQWSRTKVRKFLNDLEKEQQVKQLKSKSYTVIRLINYNDYQDINREKTTEEQEKNNSSTTERQQKDTNNNVNNGNNDNKEGTPVKNNIPSLGEVREYFKEHGYDLSVAEKAYNIYNASVEGTQRKYWRDSRDNLIKNWKLKMQSVWFKPENKAQQTKSPFRPDAVHL